MAGVEYERALELIEQTVAGHLVGAGAPADLRRLAQDIVIALRSEHAIVLCDD
jgi:hypothetical protein